MARLKRRIGYEFVLKYGKDFSVEETPLFFPTKKSLIKFLRKELSFGEEAEIHISRNEKYKRHNRKWHFWILKNHKGILWKYATIHSAVGNVFRY